MRATAQDREAAAMMGIDVDRTISFTFLLAGCLAGVAGVIYALYFTNLTFLTGFRVGLIAFTAAVFGGIGNLPGAVLGAMLIGLMEAFVNGLGWHSPGSNWTEAVIFGILILILVFRPEGLLGERTPEGACRCRRRGGTARAERIVVAARPARAAESRWGELPGWQRRLAKVSVVGLVLMLVLAPIYGFAAGAYYGFVVLAALYVPDWGRLRFGRFVLPLAVLGLCIALPLLRRAPAGAADLPVVPERRHGVRDGDLRDDGAGAEHRRRLRGAARPGLRRVLRHRRLHGGLARLAARVAVGWNSTSAASACRWASAASTSRSGWC